MTAPDAFGIVGRTVGGYFVESKIGEGGMGAVYLARGPEGVAALKVLPPAASAREELVRRFLRETEVVSALDHPNVVRAVGSGVEGGLLFLVMEYVPGESLQRRLDDRRTFSVEEVVALGRQAAVGLAAIHERGFVHRDVKPGNLLVTREGSLKVADFGLARGDDLATLSLTGQIFGSANYMSPEQGASSKGVDHRSDIYSLGATLYHMLAGVPPFQADNALAVIAAHMTKVAVPLHRLRADCPPRLSAAIQKMMAKRPENRPASMLDVVGLLDEAMTAGTPPPFVAPAARRRSSVRRPPIRRSRAPLVVAVAASALVAAVVLVAIAAGGGGAGGGAEETAPPAANDSERPAGSRGGTTPPVGGSERAAAGEEETLRDLRRNIEGSSPRDALVELDRFASAHPGARADDVKELREECLARLLDEARAALRSLPAEALRAPSWSEAQSILGSIEPTAWPAELEEDLRAGIEGARRAFLAEVDVRLSRAREALDQGDNAAAKAALDALACLKGGEREWEREAFGGALRAALAGEGPGGEDLPGEAAGATKDPAEELGERLGEARRIREAGDLVAALAALEALAAEPRFAELGVPWARDLAEAGALVRVHAAFLEAVRSAAGSSRTLELAGRRVSVLGLSDGVVRVAVDGAEFSIPAKSVSAEERADAARSLLGNSPSAHLDLGVFLFLAGLAAPAKKDLLAARKGGLAQADLFLARLGEEPGAGGEDREKKLADSWFRARPAPFPGGGDGYRYAFEDRGDLADFLAKPQVQDNDTPVGYEVLAGEGMLALRQVELRLDRRFEPPLGFACRVRQKGAGGWSILAGPIVFSVDGEGGIVRLRAEGKDLGSRPAPALDEWKGVRVSLRADAVRVELDGMQPIEARADIGPRVEIRFDSGEPTLELSDLTFSRLPSDLAEVAAREDRIARDLAGFRPRDRESFAGAKILANPPVIVSEKWRMEGEWAMGEPDTESPSLQIFEPGPAYRARFAYEIGAGGRLEIGIYQGSPAYMVIYLPTTPGEHSVDVLALGPRTRVLADGLRVVPYWSARARSTAMKHQFRLLGCRRAFVRVRGLEFEPLAPPAGTRTDLPFDLEETWWTPTPVRWSTNAGAVAGSGDGVSLYSTGWWRDLVLEGEVRVVRGKARVGLRDGSLGGYPYREGYAYLEIVEHADWRKFRLEAKGDRVQAWLDGKPVELGQEGPRHPGGNLHLRVLEGEAEFRSFALVSSD
ncbi:MAG: serine/threonine protein kinase [Planctomycetes bacterium]|nr:serine/threonine protein kinase [Planctomycetota bacterium]